MTDKRFSIVTEPKTGQRIYTCVHPTGVRIAVMPMPAFTTGYAVFSTKYGSLDRSFRTNGEEVTVPDGIAHFLEHKLFENEDCDAFAQYAQTGADANAGTGFAATSYVFSAATEGFLPSLRILLSFVQAPYFTDASVAKEQGIIGQEINMYLDNPQWRVMFNALGGLYHDHPIKVDIAGTRESISHITPQLLYQCYNTFYHPSNMQIVVCAAVEPEEVLALCDELLQAKPPVTLERVCPQEPAEAAEEFVCRRMSVARPLFQIFTKDADVPCTGEALVRKTLELEVLTEIMFGRSSEFYTRLYEEGLIDGSFDVSQLCYESCSAVGIGGSTDDPRRVYGEYLACIDRFRENGIPEAEFSRIRKAVFGKWLRLYNDPQQVAYLLLSLLQNDCVGFDLFGALEAMTPQSLHRRLTRVFAPGRHCCSVVEPLA